MKDLLAGFALAACVATTTAMAGNGCTVGEPVHPTSSYVLHDDGTATDKQTGLMWKRCLEGQTWDGSINACIGTASNNAWLAALALAEGSTYAGHADWRLPNIKELYSTVETCRDRPTINLEVFPTTDGGGTEVWSSSPHIESNSAWYVFSLTDWPTRCPALIPRMFAWCAAGPEPGFRLARRGHPSLRMPAG